ncbi:hypothetical protein KGO95_03315 [Patescibacteria group bacterium]|nr:hypothetical protein [Patescibacteria group bacterium]
MTNTYIPTTYTRILALDPTTEGLAYAILEKEPKRLVDWGVKNFRGTKSLNYDALGLATDLLDRYGPDVLVLEDYKDDWRRTRTTQNIMEKIATAARKRKIKVLRYSREEVQATFEGAGAITKEEIAHALTTIFPELIPRLPRHREIWMTEDYRMNIFDAAALAVTGASSE